jgi:hypothetical protein
MSSGDAYPPMTVEQLLRSAARLRVLAAQRLAERDPDAAAHLHGLAVKLEKLAARQSRADSSRE